MDSFLTWEALTSYSTFVAIVFTVVEFIKDLPFIRLLPTRYVSFVISFILLGVTNAVVGDFTPINLFLYALSSIYISLGANGLSDFGKKIVPKKEEKIESESRQDGK